MLSFNISLLIFLMKCTCQYLSHQKCAGYMIIGYERSSTVTVTSSLQLASGLLQRGVPSVLSMLQSASDVEQENNCTEIYIRYYLRIQRYTRM